MRFRSINRGNLGILAMYVCVCVCVCVQPNTVYINHIRSRLTLHKVDIHSAQRRARAHWDCSKSPREIYSLSVYIHKRIYILKLYALTLPRRRGQLKTGSLVLYALIRRIDVYYT